MYCAAVHPPIVQIPCQLRLLGLAAAKATAAPLHLVVPPAATRSCEESTKAGHFAGDKGEYETWTLRRNNATLATAPRANNEGKRECV